MKTKSLLIIFCISIFSHALFGQSAELSGLYAKKVEAFNQGDFETAVKWGEQATAKALAEFGENEMYANYAGDLANLYFQLKLYSEAQPLFEKIVKIYEQKLGPLHVYTAVTHNNLGNIYRLSGNNAEALSSYKKALAGYKNSLERSNDYYLITRNSIIDLCREAGFNKDLEEIYRDERQHVLLQGKENPEYVAWTNNLAMVLEETERYSEAEVLYKECIDILQKDKDKYPEDFPTLNANLGMCYLNQNKLDDAEKYLLRSLVESHSNYATHLSNLGMVYQRKNQFDRALDLYNNSLLNFEKLGQDTSRTYRMVVYNTASMLDRNGKYREEIALLKKADKKSRYRDPRLLNEMAIAMQSAGDYKRADSVFNVVMNLPKNSKTFSSHEQMRATTGRADVWRVQGKLKEAEKMLLDVIVTLQKDSVKQREPLATLNHNLAYLYKTMGDFPKAERLAVKALAQYESIHGRESEYANMVKNLGSLYMDLVQYERAEMLIKQAMQIESKDPGENSDAYSTSLNQLGLVYFYEGRYQESKKCITRSLEIKEKVLGRQHEFFANGLVNMGNVLMEEGFFEQADPLYREAERIYKNSTGTETKNYANILHLLSKVKVSVGFYAEARKLIVQSLAIQSRVLGTQHPDYANTLNSLGMLYSNTYEYEKADSAYSVSLKLRKAAGGNKSYSYAQSLNNIAELYMFTGRSADAEKMYAECLSIAANTVGQNHPDYATYLNNSGQAKFKSGKNQEAQVFFEKAIALREKIFGTTHLNTLEAKSNLLVALEAQGKSKEAEKLFSFLNEQYLDFVYRKFPHLTEKEKAAFYSTINYHFESFQSFALKRRAENPAILGQMYDIQLATKAVLLNSSRKVKEQVTNSSDDKLKSLYNDWLNKREYLAKTWSLSETEIASRKIQVNKLEAQADSLERKLSASLPSFSGAYTSSRVSWKDIKKNLKPGEAAIEMCRFYVFDKAWIDSLNYAALIVTSTSENPEVVVLQNGKMIETRFLKYYRATIRGKLADRQSWTNYWEPIQRRLGSTKKIFFAPDGVYNEININTLTDSAGRSLIDRLSVHVLTSTKEIIPVNSGKSSSKKTMLFGRPSYKMESSGVSELRGETTSSRSARWLEDASFADLPGTQKEVEEIAAILKKSGPVEMYLGDEAREEIIKKSSDAGILHIATHGFFIPEQKNEFDQYARQDDRFSDPMLRSGIVLAGVENFQQGTHTGDDDGILTAMEVCNLRLDNTDLVVMSACETGLGEVRYGEGVYGLQRAFRIAGAKAMIMSLWKVDDQATQEMMVSFYNQWTKLSDKRKAFENAQLEIRNKYKDAYYWGTFVLLGE